MPKSVQEEILSLLKKANKKNTTEKRRKKRTFGYAKGKVHLAEDFNAPLEAFNDYT